MKRLRDDSPRTLDDRTRKLEERVSDMDGRTCEPEDQIPRILDIILKV
jgi:hypothetical protein